MSEPSTQSSDLAVEAVAAFTPNGRVSQRARWVLFVLTAGILSLAWWSRPSFLPGPSEVVSAVPNLVDQGLLYHLMISLTTNLQALGITCLMTVPLAYLTVLPAVRPLVSALSKMRFLGLTGFVVIFTIFFGGGHALKIALLVFGMSLFLITALSEIIEGIPREEFDHARTLRMGPWRSVLEVVVVGRFDAVLDAIRQNAAMGWVLLTMVEGLVRFEGGLGSLMLAEDKHLRFEAVFALQAIVFVVGIMQDKMLLGLRRMLCPYADLTLERRD